MKVIFEGSYEHIIKECRKFCKDDKIIISGEPITEIQRIKVPRLKEYNKTGKHISVSEYGRKKWLKQDIEIIMNNKPRKASRILKKLGRPRTVKAIQQRKFITKRYS